MINISERSEDLKYKEDMEKYLKQHPDRNIALEQIMKIEMDCKVGNFKEFGIRHITIMQPIDVKLNKEFVDLLEKMNCGESCVGDNLAIELGSAVCEIGE